jgi:hypothetical protein
MADDVNPSARPGGPVVGASPSPRGRNRSATPRPRHFFVKEDSSSLRVGFRWIWFGFTRLVGICLIWNCFVVLWWWNALRRGDRLGWLAIVFTIPHAAVGVLLVYATLAWLLNRSVVMVTSEFITVRHGPVPWFGNRRMRVDELERLSCDRDTDPKKRGGRYVYGVNAMTKGASKVDLITDLESAQAVFIKQELERWLNRGGTLTT